MPTSLMASNCANGILARALRGSDEHDPSCAMSDRQPDSGPLDRLKWSPVVFDQTETAFT